MCSIVLQCVAVEVQCSTVDITTHLPQLSCVFCCIVVQYDAASRSVLPCVAVCCSVLQPSLH